MLSAAARQYAQQQRITALGVAQARKTATRGSAAVATVLGRYQYASAALAIGYAPELLSEQGISSDADGHAVASSVLTGAGAADLFDQAATDAAFARLAGSLIADAGRTAQFVDLATRPAATGYIRTLTPPSCGRCAVLAGRVYRHSTGFQRHPGCDCLMTPTNEAVGQDLVTVADPAQITDLSAADREALDAGADLGQIVNVRRKAAGLTRGGSVLERSGRPTPAGIYAVASSRAEALELFKRFGYVL